MMKNTKLYISLFLWLAFGIVITTYFFSNKDEQLKAIKNTNKFVVKNTQTIWKQKLKKLKKKLAERGNDFRDIKVYDGIENSYSFINTNYENATIDFENLINILPDSTKVVFRKEQKQKFVTTQNQVVKEIYQLNLYQNAYNSLHYEYSKFGSSHSSFSRTSIVQESDSTFGFYSVWFPLEMELPQQKVELVYNYKKQDYNWKLFFPKDYNYTDPIIFQFNTYTETDTIRKRYQIKPQKGKKLKPFEYEEIEIK